MKTFVIALVPATAVAFLTPTHLKVWSQQVQHSRVPLCMRSAVMSKSDKLQLRHGLFDKTSSGYKVVTEESEYEDPDVLVEDGTEAFSYSDFDAALEEDSVTDFNKGDVIKGTVVEIESNGALIDIGYKAPAYLAAREVSIHGGVRVEDVLKINQEVDFQVISDADDDNGVIYLSIKRLEYERAWIRMQQLQDSDVAFDCEVISVNKGGAIVQIEGLRGFLPGSHLSGQVADEALVGKKIRVKFLEVNKEVGKLVVSHRRAMLEDRLLSVSRGDVVNGVVKILKPYGAFVEVNGMSGLLHISQVSYDRIDDLSAVLQPGTAIKCMIVDHDKVNGRIALSTKTLEPEPGDMIKNRQRVFELAEETARKYHERMEAERKAREEAAKDIVLGLSEGVGSLDGLEDIDAFKVDPLAGLQMEPIFPSDK